MQSLTLIVTGRACHNFHMERLMRMKYRYLDHVDRKWLERLLKTNTPVTKIAKILRVSRATIYREIQRGMDSKQGMYHAALGQAVYDRAIKRRGRKLPAPAGAGTEERGA